MKTWTVKTVVGPNHQVAFKVPEDIPEGPVEIVVVVQDDWNAAGMESYDAL